MTDRKLGVLLSIAGDLVGIVDVHMEFARCLLVVHLMRAILHPLCKMLYNRYGHVSRVC